MFQLRREFFDGPDRPELVLLHYTAAPKDAREDILGRSSLVMPPAPGARREVSLFLPEPTEGEPLSVSYFFSTVRNGREWFSPAYEVAVPAEGLAGNLVRIEEAKGGNLRPAAGWGTFRVPLPLREGETRTGAVHYGFGAMRKKPSPDLCRATLPLTGDRAPVIESPEALSVLKSRPMPFFLYHYTDDGPGLIADKIGSARITLEDREGDVVCARLLWSDTGWTAPNIRSMEAKNAPSSAGRDSGYFFAEDREAWLGVRERELAGRPVPRTFEGYVFGPSGSDVQYCFQVLRRLSDGSTAAEWRNREGGNWTITL
jgi:hypothetical protein